MKKYLPEDPTVETPNLDVSTPRSKGRREVPSARTLAEMQWTQSLG